MSGNTQRNLATSVSPCNERNNEGIFIFNICLINKVEEQTDNNNAIQISY